MTAVSNWLNKQFELWNKARGGNENPTTFARYLGVPQPSLARWMNGDNPIRDDNMLKIANKLGPEIYDIAGKVRPPNFSHQGADTELEQMTRDLASLPPHQRRVIQEIIRAFAAQVSTGESETES